MQCIEAARADQGISHANLHQLSCQILSGHLQRMGVLPPDKARLYPLP